MTSQCRLTCKKTLAQTNSTTISHRGLKGKGLGERVIDRLVRCQERHCIYVIVIEGMPGSVCNYIQLVLHSITYVIIDMVCMLL